jgi:hypothetical protein
VEPVFRFQPTKIDKSFADLLFFIGSQFGHFVGIIRRNSGTTSPPRASDGNSSRIPFAVFLWKLGKLRGLDTSQYVSKSLKINLVRFPKLDVAGSSPYLH